MISHLSHLHMLLKTNKAGCDWAVSKRRRRSLANEVGAQGLPPLPASVRCSCHVLVEALKWQIWGVAVSAQVSTEQPALTPAQTYLLPLFLLSHSECRQKQLSHTSSKMPELSPSPRSPAPSEVLRALCSQIAQKVLPHLSTIYSPGCRAREQEAVAIMGWCLWNAHTGQMALGRTTMPTPAEPRTGSSKPLLCPKAWPC